jgi:hypothetical protein
LSITAAVITQAIKGGFIQALQLGLKMHPIVLTLLTNMLGLSTLADDPPLSATYAAAFCRPDDLCTPPSLQAESSQQIGGSDTHLRLFYRCRLQHAATTACRLGTHDC